MEDRVVRLEQILARQGDELIRQQEVINEQAGTILTAHGAVAAQNAIIAALPHGGQAARTLVKPPRFANKKDDEWYVFRKQFDRVRLLNRYGENEAKLTLASCMDGAAAQAVTDIAPDDNDVDFEAMLNAYEAMFMSAPAGELARIEFDGATQRPKENEVSWHARLRTLHTRAYPDVGDQTQLVRRFQLGLRNPGMREHVFRAHPADYNDALAAAQDERAVIILGKATRAGSSLFLGGKDAEEMMEIDALLGAMLDPSKAECFNCGEVGHFRRNCRKPLKKAGYSGGVNATAANKNSVSGPGRGKPEEGRRPPNRNFVAGRYPPRLRRKMLAGIADIIREDADDDENEEPEVEEKAEKEEEEKEKSDEESSDFP